MLQGTDSGPRAHLRRGDEPAGGATPAIWFSHNSKPIAFRLCTLQEPCPALTILRIFRCLITSQRLLTRVPHAQWFT